MDWQVQSRPRFLGINCAIPWAPFLLTSSTRSRLSCQSRLAKKGIGRSLSWADVNRVLHKLSSDVGCGGAVGVSACVSTLTLSSLPSLNPPNSEFNDARRSGTSRSSGLRTWTGRTRGPNAAKLRRSPLWVEDSISISRSRLARRSPPRNEYFGSGAAPVRPSSRIVKTRIARISPFPHTQAGQWRRLGAAQGGDERFPLDACSRSKISYDRAIA